MPKMATEKHIAFVDDVMMKLDSKAAIRWEEAIDTASNLNFQNFQRILTALGIDDKPYKLKGLLVDQSLVYKRHSIAHGVREEVDKVSYDNVYKTILGLLEQLKTDLLHLAGAKTYMRSA